MDNSYKTDNQIGIFMRKIAFGAVLAITATLLTATPSNAAALAVTFPSSTSNFTPNTWQSVATVTGVTPAVTGGSGGSIRVTVSAGTNGRVRLATTTNVTAADGFTLTDFNAASSGLETISFKGLVADVSGALGSLQFRRITDNGSNSITVEAVEGDGLIYDNRYYEVYTSANINWHDAFKLAASKRVESTTAGVYCQGYLATITSAGENTFVYSKVNADAWLGGSDAFDYINASTGATTYADQAASEGKWFWISGPERGTQFSTGAAAFSGRYKNWNNSEPNNSGSGEHGLQVTSSTGGGWNDLDRASAGVSKLIVEYGGVTTTASWTNVAANVNFDDAAEVGTVAACTPAIVNQQATGSFSALSAVVPGAPTIGTATAKVLSADLTWTAPASNGGSAITGYRIDLSTDNGANYSTKVANTGNTDVTATISDLSAGTSYLFRVYAINAVGTSLGSAASTAVTVLAAPKYTGPLFTSFSSRSLPSGQSNTLVLDGERLNLISDLFIGTQKLTFTTNSKGQLVVQLPQLAAGTYSIRASYEGGASVTHQDAITIQGSSAVTSVRRAGDSVEVRVESGQRSQIILNGRRVATRSSTGTLTRTLNLRAGLNVIQVVVDGQVVRTVRYTR